jgi:regulator of replication initiation timing
MEMKDDYPNQSQHQWE